MTRWFHPNSFIIEAITSEEWIILFQRTKIGLGTQQEGITLILGIAQRCKMNNNTVHITSDWLHHQQQQLLIITFSKLAVTKTECCNMNRIYERR